MAGRRGSVGFEAARAGAGGEGSGGEYCLGVQKGGVTARS